MVEDIISVILAGGQGSRLSPLTKDRAKPAVPIGGKWRIIDFVIANILHSGIRSILVLTQYAPASLHAHLASFWIPLMGLGGSLQPLGPKMRIQGEERFRGTADAVFQHMDTISSRRYGAKYVAILGGDHIYKMHVGQVAEYHKQKRSAFTICAHVVSVEVAAGQLGVLQVDKRNRIINFFEKPSLAAIPHIPGRPGFCLASMGNYVVDVETLAHELKEDADNPDSEHDFGKNVIPQMHAKGLPLFAYPSDLNEIDGQPEFYWRDLGTLAEYYTASMEMLQSVPPLNLRHLSWQMFTFPDNLDSARFLGENSRLVHCSTAGGVIVDDAIARWSTLGRNVILKKTASVEGSHLFDNVTVSEGARLRNVICDKDVIIPSGAEIGYNAELDDKRGLHVEYLNSDEWLTVIPKGYLFN